MSAPRGPDENAWGGRSDLRDPTCARSAIQSRDPLDGWPVAPFLERLAARRGREAVAAEVRAWLKDARPLMPAPADGWARR